MGRCTALFAAALIFGCAGQSALSRVTGTVAYRERIAMPPDAVVEVRLEDVSRADVPATVIGSVTIEDPGNVPVRFEIPYDPADIDEQGSYSVRARILVDGRARWVSEAANPVLTRGNAAGVEIMLKAAGDGAGEPPPEGESTVDLAETYWKLTSVGDQPVAAADGRREPYMTFRGATSRVEGSGGCNQFGGEYTIEGSTLEISGTVSTLMACIEGMETEAEFLAALEAARSWRIEGMHLELYDASGVRLARFEATHMD